MAKFLLAFLFLNSALHLSCQNLIQNWSFEEYTNGCPVDLNELPVHWKKWRGSPNSFNTCVNPMNLTDSLGDAPETGCGYQYPYSGNSFVGLLTYSNPPGVDYREIIGTELTQTLTPGVTYYFTMKVNPATAGFYYQINWSANRLGALFTMQDFDAEINPIPINNAAHIVETEIITDTLNWTTIQGSFIADQAYSHIGIGNFFTDTNTDTLHYNNSSSLGAYYFIDEICVSPDPNCAANSISAVMQEQVDYYPNPVDQFLHLTNVKDFKHWRIIDTSGKHFESGTNDSEKLIVDVSSFQQGFYLIELFSEKGKVTEKLVICH